MSTWQQEELRGAERRDDLERWSLGPTLLLLGVVVTLLVVVLTLVA